MLKLNLFAFNRTLVIDGGISIYDAQQRLGLDMLSAGDFNTLAGFVLRVVGRIPAVGERIDWRGWSFEVPDMHGWRVNKVLARRVGADGESSEADSTLTPRPHDA